MKFKHHKTTTIVKLLLNRVDNAMNSCDHIIGIRMFYADYNMTQPFIMVYLNDNFLFGQYTRPISRKQKTKRRMLALLYT